MKQILFMIGITALLLSATACREGTADAEDAGLRSSTVTGQVETLSDSTVTLVLGELTEPRGQPISGDWTEPDEPLPYGEQPPESPEGQVPGSGEETGGNSSGQQSDTPPVGEPPSVQTPDKPETAFVAGTERVTLTVTGNALEALGELETGDVIQAEIDDSGLVIVIDPVEMAGFGSAEPERWTDTEQEESDL